jgi:transposase InsO family protein
MIRLEDRQQLARCIDEARAAGARLKPACELAGIDVRTYQRWKAGDGLVHGDRRPEAVRPTPAHALSAEERAEILRIANEPRFAEVPPARIVPMLADEGRYVASESSFQRVLRAEGQSRHRGRAKAPQRRRPPATHIAQAPNEVWCWDVTYLPAVVTGTWFYLYVILDLYSRKILGWEVHASDDADHAVQLVRRTALAEGVMTALGKPVLHGDNGATLKATSVLAMLQWLGIEPSYSRPRVSDDNAYAESLFRTAKYRPEFPSRGFATLEEARTWAAAFVAWYNTEHRHSGIRYVTPEQRHTGADHAILAERHAVYLSARERTPRRWSGATRDWTPVGAVALNPERDAVITRSSAGPDKHEDAA